MEASGEARNLAWVVQLDYFGFWLKSLINIKIFVYKMLKLHFI